MEIYEHNDLHLGDNGSNGGNDNKRGGGLKITVAVILGVLAVAAIVISSIALARAGGGAGDSVYKAAFNAVSKSVVEVTGNTNKGTASGSGVVYKISGGKTYIITNFHVSGNGPVSVKFTQYGNLHSAEILGYDDYHDIALLEVDGNFGSIAAVAAGEPSIGDKVLAVGNSLGYGIAAFNGIVSTTNRMLKNDVTGYDKCVPVFAVTASINVGMSGGGVFGLDGKIIGISTYKTLSVQNNDSTVTAVEGMNYCVPFSIADKLARRILDDRSGGNVSTISVQGSTADSKTVRFNGLGFEAKFGANGLEVTNVYVAANEQSDISVGDIITKIGTLDVDGNTRIYKLFDECLKYVSDPSVNSQSLVVVFGNGKQKKYNAMRLKY